MRRLSRAQRLCFSALLVCALLLAALLAFYLAEIRGSSAPNAGLPLVGTWLGEHGVILDLRSDGTARSKSLDYPSTGIQYFEWSMAAGKLSVEMAAEPEEYTRRIRQSIFGVTTVYYDIVASSPMELRLLDKKTGKTLSFTRTTDRELESAP